MRGRHVTHARLWAGTRIKSGIEMDAPFDILTMTLTMPLPGGLVAVILLVELTCTASAGALPKTTLAPEAKQRPVMVTLCRPEQDRGGPVRGISARHRSAELTNMMPVWPTAWSGSGWNERFVKR